MNYGREETMKDDYKIHEIAKLYGIGADSLRYYEKRGILSPRRGANGYRLYDLKDMYKLTVIRDLRQLGFSTAQIREYLESQSVENTLQMLHREEDMLAAQIAGLQAREARLRRRIASLTQAQRIEPGEPEIKALPERRCVQLSQHITRDEEMDFIIKKLHRKHEREIQDLGNQVIGAFFSTPELERGIPNVYSAVFFVLEDPAAAYDFTLPAGSYASCVYRGTYEQNAKQVRGLYAYLESRGLAAAGEPFELYRIDNRDTGREDEFLTEIQVLVHD